jgi:hypothetical protein
LDNAAAIGSDFIAAVWGAHCAELRIVFTIRSGVTFSFSTFASGTAESRKKDNYLRRAVSTQRSRTGPGIPGIFAQFNGILRDVTAARFAAGVLMHHDNNDNRSAKRLPRRHSCADH